MKKLVKNLGRIFASVMAVLCLTIFVACGSKPAGDGSGNNSNPSTPAVETTYDKFVKRQNAFASELNSLVNDVKYSSVPDTFLEEGDVVTFIGDNYFDIQNSGKNEVAFYVYEGTDETEVVPSQCSYKELGNDGYAVLDVRNNRVLSVVTINSEKYYSVVDFSDTENIDEVVYTQAYGETSQAYLSDEYLLVVDETIAVYSFSAQTNTFTRNLSDELVYRISKDLFLIEKNLSGDYSYEIFNALTRTSTALTLESGMTRVQAVNDDLIDDSTFAYLVEFNNTNSNVVYKYIDANLNDIFAYSSNNKDGDDRIVYTYGKKFVTESSKIVSVDGDKETTVSELSIEGYSVYGNTEGKNLIVTDQKNFITILNLNGVKLNPELDSLNLINFVASNENYLIAGNDLKYYKINRLTGSYEELSFDTVSHETLQRKDNSLAVKLYTNNVGLYFTKNDSGEYKFYNANADESVYEGVGCTVIAEEGKYYISVGEDRVLLEEIVGKASDNQVYSSANNEVIETSISTDSSGETVELIYDDVLIGHGTITGTSYTITMINGWKLNNYTVKIDAGGSTYTWKITNTTISGSIVDCAVSGSTSYGVVDVRLIESGDIVYEISLKHEGATINSSVVTAASQRNQYIHFYIAEFDQDYRNFETSFATSGYKLLTTKYFVANSNSAVGQINLPIDIFTYNGHAVEWFMSKTNPTALPTGINFSNTDSLVSLGSAVESHDWTFSVTSTRAIYVVARY